MATKKAILVTVILIMTVVMINSCKKDDNEPLQPLQELLASDTWYISSVTTNPTITGHYESMQWNVSDSINKYVTRPCVADNVIEFLSDNVFKISDGATTCNIYSSQTDSGTYSYDATTKNLRIIINNKTYMYDIVQKNNSTFTASVDFSWTYLTENFNVYVSSNMQHYTTVIPSTKIVFTYSKGKNPNLGKLPEITTDSASNITKTSATIYANLKSLGTSPGVTVGFCFSNTNKIPTYNDNHIVIGAIINTGSINKVISELSVNSTYYFRVYASHTNGTTYGDVKTFKTFDHVFGTMTDIEGNTYKTIQIGNQIWMAENLKTTKYNDGTAIPNVTDNTVWAGLTTGAYCWYNNSDANKTAYGALYNWHAVNTGKLAPAGWHVPTDAEWKTLTTYLGGGNVAGGKMKETGTTHWQSPNAGATNESGFTAFPGGERNYYSGSFYGVGFFGKWWSFTESDTGSAWSQNLNNSGSSIYRDGYYNKKSGISVRLLKD